MTRRSISVCVASALTLLLPALLLSGCPSTGSVTGKVGTAAKNAATGGSVDVPKIPKDVEEFRKWRDSIAGEPLGGAAAYLVAMYIYTQDEELGLACITVSTDASFLVAGNKGYKGKQLSGRYLQNLTRRIKTQPWIAAAHFQGTSHEEDYKMPAELEISFKESRDTGENMAKVFVWSTGADTARPITLKKNNRGVWKAYEWSSVQVGIRKPKGKPVDDDF